MAFEYLIGLQVTDEAEYARYREGMTPLLHEVGGSFRYDFRVSEVLKSESDHPINRVFVIAFPSREVADSFFAEPRYLAVRKAHFDSSVHGVTRIIAHQR
jgi:uncharacterized protein (DUF1330 family)